MFRDRGTLAPKAKHLAPRIIFELLMFDFDNRIRELILQTLDIDSFKIYIQKMLNRGTRFKARGFCFETIEENSFACRFLNYYKHIEPSSKDWKMKENDNVCGWGVGGGGDPDILSRKTQGRGNSTFPN